MNIKRQNRLSGNRLRKPFKQAMPLEDSEIFETKNVISPAIFDVIGMLKDSVKNAKERIESIFNDNFSDDCIEDEEIAYLSDTVIQNVLQWGAEFNVRITIKKGCTNEIRVQGLTKDVKEVLKAVEIELKSVLKKELDQHHQYQIYQVIQWQYEECNQYSTFDRETNFHIENHFSEGETEAVVEWNGKSLFIEFQQKIATVLETGDVMNIKRQNRLSGQDFPRNWAEMSSSFIQIPLDPTSPEYQDVMKHFQKTAAGYEVVKIERVQNVYLHHGYEVKKKQLTDKHGSANLNELHLFHGTSGSSCASINKQGFNRSFAGKNATMFGKGVYFAVEAAYSAKKFCPPDSEGLKYVYFARVLVGQYTKGQSNIKVPPPRSNKDSTDLYDSVVDNISKPMKYVVFHDDQAYPDYLITFR
ncbi:protein mono-ADP-ribosyltransferase PARP14-like [Protopterus annectens]|uniref:protein mono-ADP-ribosyltransferase PARP14-like n=1 Tax=Protopterus annectens TaxID=7888 RepID=UPI001CFBC488|nr:protein mono-ADP-ribosyltransferase PARP14-like [Protopterus annectens]